MRDRDKNVAIALLTAALIVANYMVYDLSQKLDDARAALVEAHDLMTQVNGLVDQLLDACRPKPKEDSL